jgi:hypothetical protein
MLPSVFSFFGMDFNIPHSVPTLLLEQYESREDPEKNQGDVTERLSEPHNQHQKRKKPIQADQKSHPAFEFRTGDGLEGVPVFD